MDYTTVGGKKQVTLKCPFNFMRNNFVYKLKRLHSMSITSIHRLGWGGESQLKFGETLLEMIKLFTLKVGILVFTY